MKRFVDGREVELSDDSAVEVTSRNGVLHVRSGGETHTAAAVRQGDAVLVSYQGRQYLVEKAQSRRTSQSHATGEIHAPMPGLIVDVLVQAGLSVVKGQKLLVLEAMKTQQAFAAPFDGTVKDLKAEKGRQVVEGELLAFLVPEG